MKKLLIFIISTVLLISGCASNSTTQKQAASVSLQQGEVSVTALNVGKADCIIITDGNETMMIDAGWDTTSSYVLNYLEDNNISKLDYLIITHFDKDHIGGVPYIIQNIEVDNIIAPNYEGENDEYILFANAVKDKNLTSLTDNMNLSLCGADFTIYPPEKEYYKSGDNDYSLITSMVHGENSFMFAGDAESKRIKEILALGDIAHTYLKIPHHGRAEKNSEEFFDAVSPKYAVICVSKNELDAGESAEVDESIELLKNIGTEIYITENGDVTAVSNGTEISVMQ